MEKLWMRSTLLKLMVAAQRLREEDGQDLIEYALVVSLIAFAAVAGMNTLASDINAAFIAIGDKLNSSV
jgi:pilus assembly protein Flp/PilA